MLLCDDQGSKDEQKLKEAEMDFVKMQVILKYLIYIVPQSALKY